MIKKYFKKLPALRQLLRLISKRRLKNPELYYDSPKIWLSKLLIGNNILIVQIGSNDGLSGDPVYELVKNNSEWKALFVEPIPYLFEKLKQNYGYDSRFIFENVAINDGTKQIFYTVKKDANVFLPDLPSWYDQLGSFNKENILKHLDGILEPYIEEILLQGLTLEELLNKNKINEISLLHIDAEGYDWKILSQLNLDKINTEIILIEHKHLSKDDKCNMINFLKNSYFIFNLGGDMIAIKKTHVGKSYFKNLRGVQIA